MKHIWAIIFTVLLRFTVGEEQEASGADIGTVSRVQEDEEDCHVIVKNIKIWMVDVILLLSCLIIIFIIIYTEMSPEMSPEMDPSESSSAEEQLHDLLRDKNLRNKWAFKTKAAVGISELDSFIIYTLYYIFICLAELDVVYIETIDI